MQLHFFNLIFIKNFIFPRILCTRTDVVCIFGALTAVKSSIPQKMEPIYRYFKYCVLGFCFETGVIKSKTALILISIWYSTISFLFGWWGISIKPFKNFNAIIEALQVSFAGGTDFTKEMNETKYDSKTNYIWNNLLRKTIDRIKKDEV
jgi:hypothetical protein